MNWTKCSHRLPEQDVVVETKIHDEKGERNNAQLVLHSGLWWLKNMEMYVYYNPTHWREVNEDDWRKDR